MAAEFAGFQFALLAPLQILPQPNGGAKEKRNFARCCRWRASSESGRSRSACFPGRSFSLGEVFLMNVS